MDPSGLKLVAPDQAVTGDGDTRDGDSHFSGRPSVRPTREALDFLEQALTTGIPMPSYHGPIRRFSAPPARYTIDEAFALPLIAPSHAVQSTPSLHLALKYRKASLDPDVETCSPADLTKIPADAIRDPQVIARQPYDTSRETSHAQSPPRGTFSGPKPRGILQKGDASRAQSEAQGKVAANTKRRNATGGPRRAVKFQLPQVEAEAAPPDTAQGRPRFMVTIKSHTAARKWEELEKGKK